MNRVISNIGLSPESIRNGQVEQLSFDDNGKPIYTFSMPEGYKTMLFDGDLIGMTIACCADLSRGLKIEYIKEFNIDALNVLSKNKQSDLHFVFDAKKYIEYCSHGPEPIIPPIVVIMLYRSDIKLITDKLGYPVIDSAQFKN